MTKKLRNKIFGATIAILVIAASSLIPYWCNKPQNSTHNNFNSSDSSQQNNNTGSGQQTINNNKK